MLVGAAGKRIAAAGLDSNVDTIARNSASPGFAAGIAQVSPGPTARSDAPADRGLNTIGSRSGFGSTDGADFAALFHLRDRHFDDAQDSGHISPLIQRCPQTSHFQHSTQIVAMCVSYTKGRVRYTR